LGVALSFDHAPLACLAGDGGEGEGVGFSYSLLVLVFFQEGPDLVVGSIKVQYTLKEAVVLRALCLDLGYLGSTGGDVEYANGVTLPFHLSLCKEGYHLGRGPYPAHILQKQGKANLDQALHRRAEVAYQGKFVLYLGGSELVQYVYACLREIEMGEARLVEG